MKERKKRKATSELNNLITQKRRYIQSQDKNVTIEKLQKQIRDTETLRQSLKGPENILKFKVLTRKLEDLNVELTNVQTRKHEKDMHSYMAMIDRLEKTPETNNNKEKKLVIPLDNRLHPPRPNRRNIFDTMTNRDADKWKLMRTHKKRYAVLFAQDQPASRVNPVDVCQTCGVDRHVDKETAISVCPKCGSTRKFASHIFETKDVEKDDAVTTKQQSLSHMQKFSSQFERGYPNTPIDILEPISVAYQKIHLHDPTKVQSCRTSHFLKSLPNVPKVFKRAPDRLTKELKRESIPEYTANELSLLLNQRNRLRTPEEMGEADQKHKKSFSNQIYLRQLGRCNGMEQSRLFMHAKTCKIHMERTRALEKECEIVREKLGNQPGMIWQLYPCS